MHPISVARLARLALVTGVTLFVTPTLFAQSASTGQAFTIDVLSRGYTRVAFQDDQAAAQRVADLTAPAATALNLVEVECEDCQAFAAPAPSAPAIHLPASTLRKLTQTHEEPAAAPTDWTTVSLSYLD